VQDVMASETMRGYDANFTAVAKCYDVQVWRDRNNTPCHRFE
jgi:hypothetical protein